MPTTSVSTKGQVVIPKVVRDGLGLKVGAKLDVAVEDGRIILSPVDLRTSEELYGRFKGSDLLGDLSREREVDLRKEGVRREGDEQDNP